MRNDVLTGLGADQQGKAGELRFKTICNDARIICNKSDVDRRGWDFFIQLPDDNNEDVSLDKAKAPISALVQVKTISKQRKKVSAKLSSVNWIAKYEGPTFFYVLVKGKGHDFDDAYLIHLLNDELSHVLKKLRQTSVDEKKAANKVVIEFDLKKAWYKVGAYWRIFVIFNQIMLW